MRCCWDQWALCEHHVNPDVWGTRSQTARSWYAKSWQHQTRGRVDRIGDLPEIGMASAGCSAPHCILQQQQERGTQLSERLAFGIFS